ncbi:MAG: hypothetical protein HY898_00240 [Deltaproteobacteria bacterium]|nr:hypothetical protein [Deltaproteobacteria bacterium]
MRRSLMRSTPIALAVGAALCAAGCFVTIDESLLDQPPAPTEDAQSEAAVEGGGDATDADTGAKPDGDAGVPEVKTDGDAQPDVVSEDGKTDTGDAPLDTKDGEASTVDGDAGGDENDDGSAVDAEAGGDADAATEAATDAPVDGPKTDSGLVVCSTDADCPPVACKWRKCTAGQCVDKGPLSESVGFFDLPAGETLICNQAYNRSCVVAVGSYVVALTQGGMRVFNTRNPMVVTQETVAAAVPAGSNYLVRSGQRVWTAASSGPNVTLSWIDLPLDGTSPVPPMHQTNVYLGGPLTAAYGSPNDTIFLQTPQTGFPAFARFGPGLPTYLDVFVASGTAELTSVASSADRILLHAVSPSSPYQHSFSLQANAASSLSSNSGTVDISSFSSSDPTRGYFASNRKGSAAWLIGSFDGASWKDVRALWLAETGAATVTPVELAIETFSAQQLTSPIGPVSFIDENTIAGAVVSAALQTVALDIVGRTGPKVAKRIAMATLPFNNLTVAGDNGYAYVVRDTSVHIFAPSCNP